jgi:hypothetical protein
LFGGIVVTPHQHILSHMLIPNVLDHWHEGELDGVPSRGL